MKIVTIIGARPQFIKSAAVSKVILETEGIDEIIIHTGQHYDKNMSEIFFKELDIGRPHYNLGIGGGFHGAMTGRQLEAIETILIKEKPDTVLVYGDTNSTLSGALSAVKLHIPVAHVEAGLRSFNKNMPEEINRVIVDHIAEILFAPTGTAMKNLADERLQDNSFLVGDVMYDAALHYGKLADQRSDVISRFNLEGKKYVLLTIHRAENTDDIERLKKIVSLILELTGQYLIVFPVHPRTRQVFEKMGVYDRLKSNMTITNPVGYLDIVKLEKNALLIITDSGGMQKEAYFHKVPCLTLREETEWTELVENGFNRLIDIDAGVDQVEKWLDLSVGENRVVDLYGDGNTAQAILSILMAS